MGYVLPGGTMDTCIALRTMVVADGVVRIQAGAGVVADSEPAAEHRECLAKLAALECHASQFESTMHASGPDELEKLEAFRSRGVAAWEDFVASRAGRPYPIPHVAPAGEGADRQRELEERYFSPDMLRKYGR